MYTDPPGAGRRRPWAGQAASAPWCRGLLASVALGVASPAMALDPLPAWRDGATKDRILAFVAAVTEPRGQDYVAPGARIAVFDHEGTLWSEKPLVEGVFVLERLRELAPSHPEWTEQLPFKAALELNAKYFIEAGEGAIMELVAAAGSGLAQDSYGRGVRRFLATSRHPLHGVPYARTYYQPMRELLDFLRANGFRCFIVTGTGADFVRELADELYGIPAESVIGSRVATTLTDDGEHLTIQRTDRVERFVDGTAKPLAIAEQIGRRPILAAGNIRSGGDIAMLRYSQDPSRRSLQLLLMHDDWERESAYDEADRASLNAAEQNGWAVVSMRWDWRRVFPFQEATVPAPREATEPPAVPGADTATAPAAEPGSAPEAEPPAPAGPETAAEPAPQTAPQAAPETPADPVQQAEPEAAAGEGAEAAEAAPEAEPAAEPEAATPENPEPAPEPEGDEPAEAEPEPGSAGEPADRDG